MTLAVFLVLAYFLGSVPFGLLIGRAIKGIDVRQYGSGNVGATNVFRVVGKKWGILVFLLDALKGSLAVALPFYFKVVSMGAPFLILCGIVAILGHSFPVWLKFRGGKGVATSLGVFMTLVPVPALITFALWGIVFVIGRILSLASLAAAICFPVVLFITYRDHSLFNYVFPVSILLAIFIFYTHRTNIRRLLKGEEKKLF